MDRRNFLKTTATAAVLAGPAVIGARGASDKINIGWIGVGTRGNAGIDWLKKAAPDTVTITAICDTFQGYLARGKDRVQTIWGNTPATYENYHDLLANSSIDAVFIMTPEHLHHDMAIAALRAGKHVYLEKPLAHTIEEGFDIVREWKKSGKIVQVGTQNRSSSLYKKARNWYSRACSATCISCARSGIAIRPTTIPPGAIPFRRTPTTRTPIGPSFS